MFFAIFLQLPIKLMGQSEGNDSQRKRNPWIFNNRCDVSQRPDTAPEKYYADCTNNQQQRIFVLLVAVGMRFRHIHNLSIVEYKTILFLPCLAHNLARRQQPPVHRNPFCYGQNMKLLSLIGINSIFS